MSKQISFEFEKKQYTLEYTLRTAGQAMSPMSLS